MALSKYLMDLREVHSCDMVWRYYCVMKNCSYNVCWLNMHVFHNVEIFITNFSDVNASSYS